MALIIKKTSILFLLLINFNIGFAQKQHTSEEKKLRKELTRIIKSTKDGNWKRKVRTAKLDAISIELDTTNLSDENTIVFYVQNKMEDSRIFVLFDKDNGCLIECFLDSSTITKISWTLKISEYFTPCE